ncbi:MAG: hypothetical protein E7665_07215 [Ruminococcaceae bacterium]|nr:hypothetical protein [Oscillospiraceae bacterium]
MALIRCGECGNEVSSIARTCPHCGYYVNTICDNCRYISYGDGVPECPVRGIDVHPNQRACLHFRKEEPYWE